MCWGSVALTCDITQEWTSEDDLCRESPLSFYHVGSRDRTQVLRLASNYHYHLSHLVDPFAREGRVMDSPTMPEACHF